jgi:hypothetical protein
LICYDEGDGYREPEDFVMGKTSLFAFALVCALVPLAARAQDPEAAGQLEAAATTSPKQKIDFANAAIQEMAGAQKAVRKMLEQAEKEGESANAKVQCLNNKLASIRALEEVSNGANGSMQEALGSNNNELADFHFRKIAVSITKVRQFLAEAEACMGRTGQTGGTESVDVSGDLLSENVDDYFDDTDDIPPAPPISPFE